MPGQTLPIACSIDNNYALPLLVMLSSLKEHLRPSYNPVLYLLHRGLRDDLLSAISRVIETHSIVLDPETIANIPRHTCFPPEAASPLLLPTLLPDAIDRVLFLDADLLVLDDVAQLWETSLGSRMLGAAQDPAIPLCRSPRGVKKQSQLGIPEDAVYFNCGVMLIPLDEWRKYEVTRRAWQYLYEVGREADFLHQEALNAVLWNDWLAIDGRWNLSGSLAGRPYDREGLGDGHLNPAIVHFAGRFKPWRASIGGPFNRQYQAYLTQATQWVPAVQPTWKDKLLSLYDCNLRDSLYSFERSLWQHRLV